jgi:DNA invertase Pin-like site-specific DNA recombinase
MKGDRYRGRKASYNPDQFQAVRNLLAKETGVSIIAKTTGLSWQTVRRIRCNSVAAESALALWVLWPTRDAPRTSAPPG